MPGHGGLHFWMEHLVSVKLEVLMPGHGSLHFWMEYLVSVKSTFVDGTLVDFICFDAGPWKSTLLDGALG